jgi:hypothetical protein
MRANERGNPPSSLIVRIATLYEYWNLPCVSNDSAICDHEFITDDDPFRPPRNIRLRRTDIRRQKSAFCVIGREAHR